MNIPEDKVLRIITTLADQKYGGPVIAPVDIVRPVLAGLTPLGLVFAGLIGAYGLSGVGPVASCEAYAWRTSQHERQMSPCAQSWKDLQSRILQALIGAGALLVQSPATAKAIKQDEGQLPGDAKTGPALLPLDPTIFAPDLAAPPRPLPVGTAAPESRRTGWVPPEMQWQLAEAAAQILRDRRF